MSTRPRIIKYPALVNGDMSLASLTSAVSIIQDISLASYALSWSGSSPDGTVTIQVSNDYALNSNGSVANSGTWTTMNFNSGGSSVGSITLTGNTGSAFIDFGPTAAYAIQCVYTKVSGTGTLQMTLNAKVM